MNKPTLPYFHELSREEYDNLKDTKWSDVMLKYQQPKWCIYPQALAGSFGCWSLISTHIHNIEISDETCKTCECYKK